MTIKNWLGIRRDGYTVVLEGQRTRRDYDPDKCYMYLTPREVSWLIAEMAPLAAAIERDKREKKENKE